MEKKIVHGREIVEVSDQPGGKRRIKKRTIEKVRIYSSWKTSNHKDIAESRK